MKKIIALLVFLWFSWIGMAQINPKVLLGNWILQGTAIEGTLYFTNSWEQETLSFSEDYTFIHTIYSYRNKTILEQEIKGKWLFSQDSLSVVLFADQNRFQKDIAVKTIYKEIALYFANENFLAWEEKEQNFTQLKRFSRVGYIGNFEEELAAYQHEQLLKSKTIDLDSYLLVQENDTLQKKYTSAYFTFRNRDQSYSNHFYYKTQLYDGRITKVTDTSVFIRPFYVFKKNVAKQGSVQREFEFFPQKTSLEIPKKEIQYIHQPISSLGMKASLGITAVSAFTTLFVAPIAGLASNQNGRKHYVNTAGVGLIGVGVGIGSYFIFRLFQQKMTDKDKKARMLHPKYNRKK